MKGERGKMKIRTVAFYIRLSLADEDVKAGIKGESNSITSQRALLYDYIAQSKEYKDAKVVEYFDDGFSGTAFKNRENFQKMLSDAGEGKFECILVKDFSRLGRDYIEVGNYLEFVFPTMGIRIISVNDNYDSNKNCGMTGGMDVAFRNLIYQLYSRDLSRKVKSARRNRNINGEYTAAYTPYGYKKDKYDKHKLVIDEDVAPYIREIFTRVSSGESFMSIARDFNERKVPTRTSVQKRKCNYKLYRDMGDDLWDKDALYWIVRNEAYIGVLIQNKHEIRGFGDNKKCVLRKKEDWSIVEGGLPAIVLKEEFEKANEAVNGRKRCINRQKTTRRNGLNLFTCGYCGRKMKCGSWSKGYTCVMQNMGGDKRCDTVRINADEAKKAVLEATKEYCNMLVREQEHVVTDIQKGSSPSRENLMSEKERIENSVIGLYKRYRAGDISKESYLRERQNNKEVIANIDDKLISMDDSVDIEDMEYKVLPVIGDEYDAEVLKEIIDKVLVYGEDRIEIVFKCDDVHKVVSID